MDASTAMVTEAARYLLGFAIAGSLAALGVAIAVWTLGRRSGSKEVAARGLLGVLTMLVALTLVLLLTLIYAL